MCSSLCGVLLQGGLARGDELGVGVDQSRAKQNAVVKPTLLCKLQKELAVRNDELHVVFRVLLGPWSLWRKRSSLGEGGGELLH